MLTLVAYFPSLIGRVQPSISVKMFDEVRKLNIGEKIYQLRKKKNLSQEDLASILNVSRQTISKWETGDSTPDLDKIVPLCNFFEISTDEFLKGRDVVYERKLSKEKSKNKALTFSLCLIIFAIMIILTMLLDELEVSEGIIGSIIMFGITLIGVLLIYYFVSTPKEKKQDKKEKIINKIIFLLTAIFYFAISFIWNSWAYTWIIWIIGILVMQVVKLIRMLRGKQDEEK